MTQPTATTDDIDATARDTTIAQWSIASVVMVGSAAAAGFAFDHLGEHGALGVITALAVDLALGVWLLISRRLRAVDITAYTGRVLEGVTLAMTLYLNVGSALFRGIDRSSDTARVLLGVAHGFLPIVLFLVSLAGAEAHHKLTKIKREAARNTAEEQNRLREEHATQEQEHAEQALHVARVCHQQAQELREEAEHERNTADQVRATAQRLKAEADDAVAAQLATQEQLRQLKEQAEQDRGTPATPEERRSWIRAQRAAGEDVTGAQVNARFGAPRNGARLVKEVAAEAAAEAAAGRALKSVRSA